MEKYKYAIYWLILVILGFIVLFFLIKLFPIYQPILVMIGRIIVPFIVAAFLSYLLHPIILKLHSYKLNKAVAVIVIYLVFLLSIGYGTYRTLPVFVQQLEELSEHLPQLVMIYEDFIYNIYESTAFLPPMVHEKIDAFIVKAENSVDFKINLILNKVTHLFDFIVILTVIPVLTFYFLKDFSDIKRYSQRLLPYRHYHKMNQIVEAIDESLGQYVRGQFLLSGSVMFVTVIIYSLLDIKYALLLAMFIGLMNVIPYFGPIIGTIPAIVIALTMSWKTTLFVLLTTVIVQILESSFLSPYIMGRSVQIHPILIILILLVGAELAGIVGMIIAIPIVTIFKAVFLKLTVAK